MAAIYFAQFVNFAQNWAIGAFFLSIGLGYLFHKISVGNFWAGFKAGLCLILTAIALVHFSYVGLYMVVQAILTGIFANADPDQKSTFFQGFVIGYIPVFGFKGFYVALWNKFRRRNVDLEVFKHFDPNQTVLH